MRRNGLEKAESFLENIDQCHLEFAKRAAVSSVEHICNIYFMYSKRLNISPANLAYISSDLLLASSIVVGCFCR